MYIPTIALLQKRCYWAFYWKINKIKITENFHFCAGGVNTILWPHLFTLSSLFTFRSIVSFSLRHRTTVVTAVSDEQPPSHFSHSPFLTEPPYFSSLLRYNVLQSLFIIVPTNYPLLNPKSQIEGLLPLLEDWINEVNIFLSLFFCWTLNPNFD
jgi:hypothetical protein